MAAVGRSHATRWAVVNVVVVLYALFPVWWIVALSFKDPRRRMFAGWRPVGLPAEVAA